MTEELVRASGCVVWRVENDSVQLMAVHRPRYDDWSWPKGKLDPGETDEECALRELEEETGFVGQLGEELPSTRYVDHKDRPKLVRYWLVAADAMPDFEFVANDEVDHLEWVSPRRAAQILSYERDAGLIEPALAGIGRASTGSA